MYEERNSIERSVAGEEKKIKCVIKVKDQIELQ